MVVDARTRAPVPGAEVFVSRQPYKFYAITNRTIEAAIIEAKTAPPPEPPPLSLAASNARPPTVITGIDGRFTTPPAKEWVLYIVPMDIFPAHGTLVVRRDGYLTEMRPIDSRTNVAFVGNIPLTVGKE